MIRYFKKVKHLYCSALDYHNRIVTAKREIDDVIDLSEDLFDKYGKLLGQLKTQSEQLASDTQNLVGEVHDDFTISVVDVFSMPQAGTTISVESVDPVY